MKGQDQLLHRIPGAAAKLDVSPRLINYLVDMGLLDRINIGRSVRITDASIKRLSRQGVKQIIRTPPTKQRR